MGARDTTLAVLIACRRDGAWADGALRKQIARDRLDRRDAALATRLCCGVLQNQLLLDYWLDGAVRGKLQPVVRDILRLAVYQLFLTDKIPQNAAVNEAVEQAKRHANPRAAGLVNAVLRNLLRTPPALPEELSVRYSHPQALTALLAQSVGQERLEPLLAANNQIPPTYAQVNTTRCTAAETIERLKSEGIDAAPHPWLDGCLLLHGSVEQSGALRDGLLYVQDPAARLAVLSADLRPGMRVLDCCAAPGGKSFAAAIAMRGQGEIVSCDIHPHKLPLIEKSAQRLSFSCISACLQDAAQPREEWKQSFDAVLADVPCSGLGVIRKKPDIRYKPTEPLAALPALQLRILNNQADYVRPGGVLLYSTCTVLRRENEDVVKAFLAGRGDYAAEAFRLPNGVEASDGFVTLLPSEHDTDGFFICKLRRLP